MKYAASVVVAVEERVLDATQSPDDNKFVTICADETVHFFKVGENGAPLRSTWGSTPVSLIDRTIGVR